MKRLVGGLVILTVIAVGIIAVFWNTNRPKNGNGFGGNTASPEALSSTIEQAVKAASHLENVEYDEAIKLYSDLLAKSPKQSSFARNLAIAYLSKIEVLVSRLNDKKYDPSEVRALLGVALDEGIIAADAAIEAQPNSEAVYQIAVEVLRHKIRQLPILADELNNELVVRLRGYIQKIPGNAALALAFDETAEELISTQPDLVKESIQSLWDAWQKHPRNLFLLHRLAERALLYQPDRFPEAFRGLMEIAKPYFAEMAIASPGTDWEKAGNEILQLIESNKLEEAQNLPFEWLNTLKRVSGFNPDNRLVQPKSLALIDLSDVESAIRARAAMKPTTATATQQAKFTENWIGENSSLQAPKFVAWYDYDVDLTPEIMCLTQDKLLICQWDPTKPTEANVLLAVDVRPDSTAAFAVDLFETQFPGASKVDVDQRKAEIKRKHPDKSDADIEIIISRRHDLLRDCLVYGPSGIQIFSTQAIADNPPSDATTKITMTLVASTTGLESLKQVSHVLPCDWDGDGDLDLAVVAEGKPRMMQNSGNRTFVETTSFSDYATLTDSIVAIESCDLDRDIDSDFVVTTKSDGVGVLENLLHGQFRYRQLDSKWDKLSKATSLAVADLDGNASWDWLGAKSDHIAIVATTTAAIGHVTPVLDLEIPVAANAVATADFNNDSWLDVLSWTSDGVTVSDVPSANRTAIAPLRLLAGKAISSLDWADANGDGCLDILALADGKLVVLQNQPDEANGFVDFRLLGINDGNGGGRVNRFAIGSTLEVFTQGRYQSQIIRKDQTHFGLGAESAYNTRIIFTNGLTQNIVSPKSNTVIEEPQFPKGSCPFLYGWDGEKWCFITDLLWNAPLGLQIAKGKVLPDRRWEYLTIPGELIQPKNGHYEIRITEELWEAAYFDHVALTAIDHPADYEVHSNEKVGPPDIAKHRLWSTKNARPIVSAKDQNGRDWTDALSARDGKYVDDIGKHICQGLVEKHYLELDLGPLNRHQANQLMLTGWIFPSDTSLNIGMDQDPVRPSVEPPSLWVPDANGEFQKVKPFMGFPGGKPKTIVVDLTDVFLTDDFRVRIETSAEIYWDQAFVVIGENTTDEIQQSPLALDSAELHYRGFSSVVMTTRDQPHWYDYNEVSQQPAWPPIEGVFTRFGDVTELLSTDDDRLVVMGSGDEMVIRFAIPDAPIPKGWKRDFVLHSTGWDKDCDLNTLEGQSSLPLPFSSMRGYPPPSSQMQRAREVDDLNRSYLTREMDFRYFWKNQISHSR
jgi:FG-GAP-like repeat